MERDVAVPGLVLDDHLVAERLEAGFPEEREIRARRSSEAKNIGAPSQSASTSSPGFSGAEGREQQPAVVEPRSDPPDQVALLVDGNVTEEVEGDDGVQGAGGDSSSAASAWTKLASGT